MLINAGLIRLINENVNKGTCMEAMINSSIEIIFTTGESNNNSRNLRTTIMKNAKAKYLSEPRYLFNFCDLGSGNDRKTSPKAVQTAMSAILI